MPTTCQFCSYAVVANTRPCGPSVHEWVVSPHHRADPGSWLFSRPPPTLLLKLLQLLKGSAPSYSNFTVCMKHRRTLATCRLSQHHWWSRKRKLKPQRGPTTHSGIPKIKEMNNTKCYWACGSTWTHADWGNVEGQTRFGKQTFL